MPQAVATVQRGARPARPAPLARRRAGRRASSARRRRAAPAHAPAAASRSLGKLSSPECVLFDLDGVLYDAPRTGYLDAVRERQVDFLVERLGVRREEAPALQAEAFALANQTARGLQLLGYELEVADFVAYCRAGAEKALSPDVETIAAVEALRPPCFVFTNTSSAAARGCLTALGLDEALFAGILGNDCYAEPKPHEAAFEAALHAAGLTLAEAHRAVLIEDSVKNARAAVALGMRSVLVTQTAERPSTPQERDEVAHHVIGRVSRAELDALNLGLY